MNLCENCYQTNIVHLNSFTNNLEYEAPNHIIDNIYLGSQKSAIDLNKLIELNIKYILILGKGMKANFDQIIYKKIEIDDSLEENLLDYIGETLDFIVESQKTASNILIHCVSGISRSASIVIVYLIKKHQMNYDEAFNYIKIKRPIIRPNSNFIQQLNNLP
jgi:protein-tyrosine phosphatase